MEVDAWVTEVVRGGGDPRSSTLEADALHLGHGSGEGSEPWSSTVEGDALHLGQ